MDEATLVAAAPNESRRKSSVRRPVLFALAVVFVLTDFLVIDAADHFRIRLGIFSTSPWNWFGKIASIGYSCAVLACSPWLRQNAGLRWQQSPGSAKLSIGCFVACGTCAIGIGYTMPRMAFSADTLAFQFLVPAIDEELLLRGIALALLELAFGRSPMSGQLRFGFAALIISLVFGTAHAISIMGGRLEFSFVIFSITTLLAALLALVRIRSGSLLWPILIHGAWDGLIFLVAMLR